MIDFTDIFSPNALNSKNKSKTLDIYYIKYTKVYLEKSLINVKTY